VFAIQFEMFLVSFRQVIVFDASSSRGDL